MTQPLVDLAVRLAASAPGCVVDEVLAQSRVHEGRTTAARGYVVGYVEKIMTYRKAASTLPDAGSRAGAALRDLCNASHFQGTRRNR
jgi:hypothetical protein